MPPPSIPSPAAAGVFAKTDVQPLLKTRAPAPRGRGPILAVSNQTISVSRAAVPSAATLPSWAARCSTSRELRHRFYLTLNWTRSAVSCQNALVAGAAPPVGARVRRAQHICHSSIEAIDALVTRQVEVSVWIRSLPPTRTSPSSKPATTRKSFLRKLDGYTGRACSSAVDTGSTTVKAALVHTWYGNNNGDSGTAKVIIAHSTTAVPARLHHRPRRLPTGYGEALLIEALKADSSEPSRASRRSCPAWTWQVLRVKDGVIEHVSNEACSSGCSRFYRELRRLYEHGRARVAPMPP